MWKLLRDTLTAFGLVTKQAKLVFVGLDNTGKTTLKHNLYEGFPSYQGLDKIDLNGIRYTIIDHGGMFRPRLDDSLLRVSGVVFLVDAHNSSRFREAKEELHKLLSLEKLRLVPFAILGNKIDHFDAVSEDELRTELGLCYTTGKGRVPLQGIRPIELFMCSVLLQNGYIEAITWISQYI